MKISFSLPIKTFSINSKFSRQRSFTTKEYKEWESKTLYQLDKPEPKAALEKVRKYINPKLHVLEVSYIARYPKEILFTKKKEPSSRCHDVTNWEKILTDLIFLPAFFSKVVPYGCRNLNIDDKILFDCNSKKRINPEGKYSIDVTITVHDKLDMFPELDQNKEPLSNDDIEEL